jgi:DNA-binding LytR/AlgR family response regulator
MQGLKIKCMIVDDEALDRLHLSALVAEKPQLHLIGEYDHALDALHGIKAHQPDLLFLDVSMPGSSGIELLKAVRELVPMAIFITSYQDFALDGFELSALDYILKPLTEARFNQSIKRVEEYWEMRQKSNAYDILIDQEMLTIKQGHDKLRLPISEVIYIEALSDYTKFHTGKQSYITLGTLSNILEQLPPKWFCRIHRSYAVAAKKITQIQKGQLFCGSIALPIGKTYKHTLYNLTDN